MQHEGKREWCVGGGASSLARRVDRRAGAAAPRIPSYGFVRGKADPLGQSALG